MEETRQTSPSPPQYTSAGVEALRILTSPLPLGAGVLLLMEGLLALVALQSRMAGGYQFICVLLMAGFALVAAQAVDRLASTTGGQLQRAPRPSERAASLHALDLSALSTTATPEAVSPGARRQILSLVEMMGEVADKARHLPGNIQVGFDEEQFSYLMIKLRATVQESLAEAPVVSAPVEARESQVHPEASHPADPELAPLPVPSGDADLQDLPQNGLAAEPQAESPATKDDAEPTSSADEVLAQHDLRFEAVVHEPLEPAQQNGADTSKADTLSAARAALRRGDPRKAADLLLTLPPEEFWHAETAELLGIALVQAGDRRAALEALERATKADPTRAKSRYNYAVLLAEEGRVLDAMVEAREALKLNPDYSAARQLVELLQQPAAAPA